MKRARVAAKPKVPSTEARSRRRTALAVATVMHTATAEGHKLFGLGENLVRATVLRRPSARNKSPYVGDVTLPCGRVAIAHMPSLDLGGKCVAGAECLLRTQIDKATGLPLGPDATGKYGTPKCEYIMQLVRCVEPENGPGGCWVGAHPSLGEKAAIALFADSQGLVEEVGGGPIEKIEKEVTGVAGTDMRCDFLLTHADGKKTVVEVKTVVDTDYDPSLSPDKMFLGRSVPYERAAIFPWGRSAQEGPDGEKVVSARAIKHVRELTAIAKGEKTLDGGERLSACVLFIVVRRDATVFRPNREACPSFARYLTEAAAAGVKVVARRVVWDEEGELGTAIDDGSMRVEL